MMFLKYQEKNVCNNNANGVYFDGWYSQNIDSLFSNVRRNAIFSINYNLFLKTYIFYVAQIFLHILVFYTLYIDTRAIRIYLFIYFSS